MLAGIVIPAYNAGSLVGTVVRELNELGHRTGASLPCLVVDDGSTDQTAEHARAAGAELLSHPENRGKGAALRTGLAWAKEHGLDVVVTADADGQHPAEEVLRMATAPLPCEALVLGVRDLARDGAPGNSRFSNGLSSFFLSLFTGLKLSDIHCGLRRYPVGATLALQTKDCGYAFEAEVILRAARRSLPIRELPVRVVYPPQPQRVSHFRNVVDPARIVARVVATLLE